MDGGCSSYRMSSAEGWAINTQVPELVSYCSVCRGLGCWLFKLDSGEMSWRRAVMDKVIRLFQGHYNMRISRGNKMVWDGRPHKMGYFG